MKMRSAFNRTDEFEAKLVRILLSFETREVTIVEMELPKTWSKERVVIPELVLFAFNISKTHL